MQYRGSPHFMIFGTKEHGKYNGWNGSTVEISCWADFFLDSFLKKHLLQIVLCQFIVLWMPMFLSSLTLSISNPGFTFGCEPNNDMQCIASVCLTLMDLSVFYLHPIILRWRISVLTKEQEGIDKSRNLALSQKYEKNAEILDLLNEQFFAFKKLELNLGGLYLLYLASVDC